MTLPTMLAPAQHSPPPRHRTRAGSAPPSVGPAQILRRVLNAYNIPPTPKTVPPTDNTTPRELEAIELTNDESQIPMGEPEKEQEPKESNIAIEVITLEDSDDDVPATRPRPIELGTEPVVPEQTQGATIEKKILPKMPVGLVRSNVSTAMTIPTGPRAQLQQQQQQLLSTVAPRSNYLHKKTRSSNHEVGIRVFHAKKDRRQTIPRAVQVARWARHGSGGVGGNGYGGGTGGSKKHEHNCLLSLEGMVGWVLVEDKTAKLHKAVVLHKVQQKGSVMSAYICAPSSTDQIDFAVGFRDERLPSANSLDLLVEIVIDGQVVKHEERLFRAIKSQEELERDNSLGKSLRTWTWWGGRESPTSEDIRPFVFEPLRTTSDGDIACSSETILKQVGTIQIKIYRGKSAAIPETNDDVENIAAVEEEAYVGGTESIGERVFEESAASVKGGGVTHQASLGPARSHRLPDPRTEFEMSPLDSKEKPYVTLEFVYRSKEILEAKGILSLAQQSPSPPRNSRSPDSSGSSRDSYMVGGIRQHSSSPALLLSGPRPPPPSFPRILPMVTKMEEEDVPGGGGGGGAVVTKKSTVVIAQDGGRVSNEQANAAPLFRRDADEDTEEGEVVERGSQAKAGETVEMVSGSSTTSSARVTSEVVRKVKAPVSTILTTTNRTGTPASMSGSTNSTLTSTPKRKSEDSEEAKKLKEEIAEFKKEHERIKVAKLRRERDEIARIVAAEKRLLEETSEDTNENLGSNATNCAELEREEEEDEAHVSPGTDAAGDDVRQKKKIKTDHAVDQGNGNGKVKADEIEWIALEESSD